MRKQIEQAEIQIENIDQKIEKVEEDFKAYQNSPRK